MGIKYASREDVKRAMDFKSTAIDNDRIDRALEGASRFVDRLCHRTFYPTVATRYFNWPSPIPARSWRLWLDANEVQSVSTLTSGGTTIPETDYFLEPINYGPPYSHIEIDLASSSAFEADDTHQRAVAVTGVFGAVDEWFNATTLDGSVNDSVTTLTLDAAPAIAPGDTVKVDDEVMLVTGQSFADTTHTVSTNALTSSMGNNTVTVSGGSGTWAVGEVIRIDSEDMLVTGVAGTTLTVKRAWDGSVLDAHTTSTAIYAPRSYTVQRAALGTSAALHSDGAAVQKLDVPGLVRELVIAEALTVLQNEGAGYARSAGSGDNEREMRGLALTALRKQVYVAHARKARTRRV